MINANPSESPEQVSKKGKGNNTPNLLQDFTTALIQTGEFDEIVRTAVPGVLKKWAGDSKIKNLAVKPIARYIMKSFPPVKTDSGSTPISDLLSSREFITTIEDQLPDLLNGILKGMITVFDNIANLPAEEKRTLVGKILKNTEIDKAGSLITSLFQVLNEVHIENPLFLSETLVPKVRDLIVSMDFGEIKEAIENSTEDIIDLAGQVNIEFWQYPSKVICFFATIIEIVNIGVMAVKKTIEPMNNMAPDLLSDVIISLIDSIKGKYLGEFINEISELVRRIHTGSALLGDKGNPLLPQVVGKLFGDTIKEIDIELLIKTQKQITEIKEMCNSSINQKLMDRPELVREKLQSYFRKAGSYIKNLSNRVNLMEMSLPAGDIENQIAAGIKNIDVQELADVINRVCIIFNNLNRSDPRVIKDTISQFVNSLDDYEVRDALQAIITDLVESLKPVSSQILPPVIRGAADLLKSDGSSGSSELKDAVDYFRKTVNREVQA